MRSIIFFMIIFALPVLAHAGDQCDPHETFSEVAAEKGNSLSGPFSVEELEKENMIVVRETGQALPFGYSNKAWLGMKAAMQPGDQIYFLSHSDGSFYVDYHILVHDGCIVRRLMGKIT
jgi:hypothetical protein